jgi:hypothetical protein
MKDPSKRGGEVVGLPRSPHRFSAARGVDGPEVPDKAWGVQEKNYMRINSILAALAAASMAAAPAVAAPKPAAAPAAEVAPQSETVEGEQIRGGFLLPLAIIIAIIIGVILLTKNDEEPASP